MFTKCEARNLLTKSWSKTFTSEEIDEVVETSFELIEKTINDNQQLKAAMDAQHPAMANLVKRYVVCAEASKKAKHGGIFFSGSKYKFKAFVLESLRMFGYNVEQYLGLDSWDLEVTFS